MPARVSGCGGEGDGEELVRVAPGAGDGEAGGGEQLIHGRGGEFVTVFGVYGPAGAEDQVESGAGVVSGDVDVLGGDGGEMHLDAGVLRVPEGLVGEAAGVEVGAEVAVDAGEDVAVERGGDAGGVVVGGDECGDGFMRARSEVGAEQQRISRSELAAEVLEETCGFGGGEVADAGADVEGKGAGVAGACEGERIGNVVGDLGVNGDAGDTSSEVAGCLVECSRGDIDGLIEDASLLPDGFAEEDASLGGGAGAEFEERESFPGGGGVDDAGGVGGKYRAFGASGVVLGERGDVFKELRAALVIEEPRGEGAGIGHEATADLGGYRVGEGGLEGLRRLGGGGCHCRPSLSCDGAMGARSFARRRPENCQRVAGEKKFR